MHVFVKIVWKNVSQRANTMNDIFFLLDFFEKYGKRVAAGCNSRITPAEVDSFVPTPGITRDHTRGPHTESILTFYRVRFVSLPVASHPGRAQVRRQQRFDPRRRRCRVVAVTN